MNYKKAIIILITMAVIITSMSAVSAGLLDFLNGNVDDTNTTDSYDTYESEPQLFAEDTLKKSSIKLKYAKPIKSTEYGYFYEHSGEFAEDAYWGQWSCNMKLTFDVEKLYEYEYGSYSNYTLKDFKKDLKYMVKHNDIDTSDIGIEGDSFTNTLNTDKDDYSSSLNDDCSKLVVECDTNYANYSTKSIKTTIKDIKKAKTCDLTVYLNKNHKHNYKTGPDDISFSLNGLPVKVSKME